MKPIYSIIGPDKKVHYRRPEGHPDIAEAVTTEGYSVRLEDPVAEEERQSMLGQKFMLQMETAMAIKGCDNRKLLWLFLKAVQPWRDEQDVMGVNLDLLNELERRLYPEYDGENVRMTDTGWITSDGAVDYIKP